MSAATVSCSVCTTTDDNPLVNGLQPDIPAGWSVLTLAERGQRINNFLMCRACTSEVRQEVHRLNARFRDTGATT